MLQHQQLPLVGQVVAYTAGQSSSERYAFEHPTKDSPLPFRVSADNHQPLATTQALYMNATLHGSAPPVDADWYVDPKLYGGLKMADYKPGHSYFATQIQFKDIASMHVGEWATSGPGKELLVTVCSTPESCRADKREDPMAYLWCSVWVGHENEAAFPRVEYSYLCGTVREVFGDAIGNAGSMMELLQRYHAEYRWAWTGYHIHQQAVCSCNPEYCPLDVYMQTSAARKADESMYEHWIITDVVAPCDAYRYQTPMTYVGKAIRDGYYV